MDGQTLFPLYLFWRMLVQGRHVAVAMELRRLVGAMLRPWIHRARPKGPTRRSDCPHARNNRDRIISGPTALERQQYIEPNLSVKRRNDAVAKRRNRRGWPSQDHRHAAKKNIE